MLAIAKKVISFSKQAIMALTSLGAISQYDLSEAAEKVRKVSDELHARGEEEMVRALDSAFNSIHESSTVIRAEKQYLQRILAQLEDDLILSGVPLDTAVEISIAFDTATELRRALIHDPSINARAQDDPEVSRRYDEAMESLHALSVAIDPWLDTGTTSPALEEYVQTVLGEDNPPSEWEKELEVMSLEEFEQTYNWVDDGFGLYYISTPDEDDLGQRLSERVMAIGDALRELDDEFPVDLDANVESTLDEIYSAYGELEELVIG